MYTWNLTYLLTYLAITTCYRSWPQLICGAIHHELLQVGVNFGYPAFLDSHQPVWPNAAKTVLDCDIHHLAQIRRLFQLGYSYPYERHDPAIEDAVFQYASLRRCHCIYRTAAGSSVCAILLSRRKVHKSYVRFSSRRRLMLAHLKMSSSRSQHLIIRLAI